MKNWAKFRASEFRSAWWIIGAANEPSGCVEFCDQIVHIAHLHSTYTRTCATFTRAVHAARHMANGRPTSLVRREKSPPPSNIYKETFSGKKFLNFHLYKLLFVVYRRFESLPVIYSFIWILRQIIAALAFAFTSFINGVADNFLLGACCAWWEKKIDVVFFSPSRRHAPPARKM